MKNAVRVCVCVTQKAVCRVDIGGLSFAVEVWVGGSVIVYGAGLLKDSCFRRASGDVKLLTFWLCTFLVKMII